MASDEQLKNYFLNQQYAVVNRLTFNNAKLTQAHHQKKALQLTTAATSSCPPFTMRELDTAIHTMPNKNATGTNDIPPTSLKALDLMPKAELLSI